jgi:hypothetical protein
MVGEARRNLHSRSLDYGSRRSHSWRITRHYDKATPSTVPVEPASQAELQVTQPTTTNHAHKQAVIKKEAKTVQNGTANGAVDGSIKTGTCSPMQVGGQGNTATSNCTFGTIDRHINPAHEQAIIDLLSKTPSSIFFQVTQGDTDALKYANEWKVIFVKAGWTFTGLSQQLSNVQVYGIHLGVDADTFNRAKSQRWLASEPAYNVGEAFKLEGVSPTLEVYRYDDHNAAKEMVLFIGLNAKPPS